MSAAGWHDDPYHRFAQRYHDGTDWTEHVSDGSGSSFVDPSGSSPYVQGPMPGPPPPGASGAAAGQRGMVSGAWIRLGARIIDGIVVGIPVGIVSSALFGPIIEFTETSNDTDGFSATWEYNMSAVLFTLAVVGVYEILMVAKYGRTVGKMACGLTILGASTGQIPTMSASAVRWFTSLVYQVPFIGWIFFIATAVMIFADSRRQTLHDKAAGTVVVKTASL